MCGAGRRVSSACVFMGVRQRTCPNRTTPTTPTYVCGALTFEHVATSGTHAYIVYIQCPRCNCVASTHVKSSHTRRTRSDVVVCSAKCMYLVVEHNHYNIAQQRRMFSHPHSVYNDILQLRTNRRIRTHAQLNRLWYRIRSERDRPCLSLVDELTSVMLYTRYA